MSRPRYAFTLAYQAGHLLPFRDFARRLLAAVDRWVVVEGAAHPRGSTAWCRPHPGPWQSDDGTRRALLRLQAQHPERVTVILGPPAGWPGKDEMVRAAVDALRREPLPAYLWQVDADEHWTPDNLTAAEQALEAAGATCGEFLCDYYLGPQLRAVGEWGEGTALPYRRLWRWAGEQFARHEPPELVGGNGRTVRLPQRFAHFAYYFERDVAFKARYYGGHDRVLEHWRRLQADAAAGRGGWPRPISALFGAGRFAKSRTVIERLPAAGVSLPDAIPETPAHRQPR